MSVELEEKSFANDVVLIDSADSNAETKTSMDPPQTEEEMRHCKHCNYQAEDWPKFSKHVFKQYHVRKIAESYNIRLSTEPVSNTFTCDICAVECTGHQSWVSHLMGEKHRQGIDLLCIDKMQNKSGGPIRNNQSGNWRNKKPYDRNTMSQASSQATTPAFAAQDFANYQEPLIGLEYVTEIQGTGELPCYRCSICEVKFDYNFKFPHLVGQKHRINVLKIKRPETLKGVNPANMKRSEITAILIREATNLEKDEGRKQVKTKVANSSSSFNANSSQQRGTGRGVTRGGRGATRGTTWNTQGGKARGGIGGAGRGNPGYTSRGAGRGNSGYTSGAGAGNFGYTTRGPHNSKGMSQPKGDKNDSFYDSYGKESFNMRNNESLDNPGYGGDYMQSSGQAYSVPSQAYSSQTHTGNESRFSGSGHGYSAPPLQSPQGPAAPIPPKEPDTPKTKEEISSGLASALGDLTKLVQNEDDASVALHVSNALTQALLQYRMQASETEDEK